MGHLITMAITSFVVGVLLVGIDNSYDFFGRKFFVGRSAKSRFVTVGVISSIVTIVGLLFLNSTNTFIEFIALFPDTITMYLGVLIGLPITRFFGKGVDKADGLFEKIDSVERGETTLGEEVRKASENVVRRTRNAVDDIRANVAPPVAENASDLDESEDAEEQVPTFTSPEPAEPSEPEKPEVNAQERLDDLLGKRR